MLKWGEVSYREYTRLSKDDKTGVTFKKLFKLFEKEVSKPYWTKLVRSFEEVRKSDLPNGYNYGFTVEVPQIEAPIYLKYLYDRFIESGGKVTKLENELTSLEELYPENKIIVNCTGLGSLNLCEDSEMFPIRGQLVKTTNPGVDKIYNDEDGPLAITYIVPRSSDCVLGGTAQENNWDLDIDPEISDTIISNSIKLVPELKDARILEHKAGLRPGRTEVRLEAEKVSDNCTVIHNYGHGGAGFTLSWGCAEEVLEILKSIISK
ncbi:MAG: FAD-binding oxidoreductase [Candidatus Dadabacteria bacterium]|nr:FAD-binding oxidoreductase [Candidatus Dadabacteria bacterium]NIV42350.1 FAD-dependent oxidoreductase [Candidatus Dadabacteria bacterium]NIX16079.1 FAD-dependent oxidoreductase [Candidatus Dadabacteria bacterium]